MVARKKLTKKKKNSTKKKATSKKPTRKMRAPKSTAKRRVAKKTAAKKANKKKKEKKKTAVRKKTAARKKVKKKTTGRKKTAARKKVKKKTTGKKKLVKKITTRKVLAKKKITPVKPSKTEKKALLRSIGKSNLLSLKSKSFRRNSTDIQEFTPYRVVRGEEFMNADQTEHFRQILLDWKKLLMEEVDRTVHHMQDEAANFPDPNDRATQEEEFALELRTRDRERKLIRKIDEAMVRLEMGDFGYCEICGVDIGIKRLEARPTATLCIDCKTLDEIKEKQMG